MNNQRENKRYSPGKLLITGEMAGDHGISGKVCDLSAGGLCLEFETGGAEFRQGEENVFLRISADSFQFIAGVQKMWSTVFDQHGVRKCRMGLKFYNITPEDRIKLEGIIKILRSGEEPGRG